MWVDQSDGLIWDQLMVESIEWIFLSDRSRETWNYNEVGMDELTEKYVGARVEKEFLIDEEHGVVRKFVGSITHVHYIRNTNQYMMHVSYMSDSDSEDMEEWQVRDLG